jgi:hypothetical protein
MSIHRKFALRPRSDAYANVEKRLVLRQTPRHMNVGLEGHKRLRKEARANTPLRCTLMWVASLPPDVQPTALVRHFARIANLIAATWRDPKSFEICMESLFIDKRGNRQGFPPEVLAELVALQRHHDFLMDDDAARETIGKRG